jgi:hypothetical protein
MPHTAKEAHEVSEYLLERTGRALMTRDADLFETCMTLPQHFETFDGKLFCETSAHLHAVFHSVVDHMQKSGVTDLVRHCIVAEFRDADTVEATHEARVLAGDNMIQPAYPVFSILKRIKGLWMVTYSMYAVSDAPEHSHALISVLPPSAAESRSFTH